MTLFRTKMIFKKKEILIKKVSWMNTTEKFTPIKLIIIRRMGRFYHLYTPPSPKTWTQVNPLESWGNCLDPECPIRRCRLTLIMSDYLLPRSDTLSDIRLCRALILWTQIPLSRFWINLLIKKACSHSVISS